VNQLWLSETKAIMRGFCDVFPDCRLWNGAGLQWMLAGTRDAHGPVPEEQFSAQWRDSVVAPKLASLGFEGPESLGTTFLADSVTLGEWTRGAPPTAGIPSGEGCADGTGAAARFWSPTGSASREHESA